MSSAIAETAERFCISCFQLGAVQHKVRVRGAAAHRPPDFASSGLNELKWKNCMYVCSNDWENIGNGATEINANLICFTFLQVACQGPALWPLPVLHVALICYWVGGIPLCDAFFSVSLRI